MKSQKSSPHDRAFIFIIIAATILDISSASFINSSIFSLDAGIVSLTKLNQYFVSFGDFNAMAW